MASTTAFKCTYSITGSTASYAFDQHTGALVVFWLSEDAIILLDEAGNNLEFE
jgi:hypothetical protein